MATNEIILCAFLSFVQSPEGLLGVSLADSPDSPVIGHASGGPVLLKEGKGDERVGLDSDSDVKHSLTV